MNNPTDKNVSSLKYSDAELAAAFAASAARVLSGMKSEAAKRTAERKARLDALTKPRRDAIARERREQAARDKANKARLRAMGW